MTERAICNIGKERGTLKKQFITTLFETTKIIKKMF
ncbi:hypothetical protein J2Y60_001893 [Arcicella sp. BE140]|nr:hypothetical protein [Arcicella sp. BE51]MDR6811695.1 hypothetical protein [Arcicella sp. BE140]MDR6823220.1 hypothetical protein [Arcicella sp. BE139]